MREAVIVSTARTPIGKAYRGAFNNTPSQTLAGHAIEHAVQRAGIEGGEIDDVIMGCAMQQGVQSLQYWPPGRAERGLACHCGRHVARPPMRLRHDGDCNCRQTGCAGQYADLRRWWR